MTVHFVAIRPVSSKVLATLVILNKVADIKITESISALRVSALDVLYFSLFHFYATLIC